MKKRILIILFIFQISLIYGQDTRVWSTYYGGTGTEVYPCITTDKFGNIFFAGQTDGANGIASGGFQNILGGINDAYLVKFDSSGNRIWCTYFGGLEVEDVAAVATDVSGNVYMCGNTYSDSAIAFGGFQNTLNGFGSAYLVKFDSSGNRLWATYYGGMDNDYSTGLCIDIYGNVYLTGTAYSNSDIAYGGFQNVMAGVCDAFVVKFDTYGNRIWASYYGGSDADRGQSVATDVFGNVFIAGQTFSDIGIAANGFQNSFGGLIDAFIVKFDSLGNRIWATYYGGENIDYGMSISTDQSGNIFLTGETKSDSSIAFGGVQNARSGDYDGFHVKFDTSGARIWSTYYGGPFAEEMASVASDDFGNVFIAGDTYSSSGISSGGFQNNLLGTENEFLVKFDSMGNRICATYFGQLHDEFGKVAVDINGSLFLAGATQSSSGIASGGFQNTFGGQYDAYIVKFNSCGVVGISENKLQQSLNIYPNPSKQITTLDFENSDFDVFELNIFNSYGQLIHKISDITSNRIELNTQGFKKGLYVINLQSNKKFFIGKLIVD